MTNKQVKYSMSEGGKCYGETSSRIKEAGSVEVWGVCCFIVDNTIKLHA